MSETDYPELIEFVAGDRLPYFERPIPSGYGIPEDLTGASLRWRMESFVTGLGVIDAAATIIAPRTIRLAHYDWTAADALLPAGRYRGRFTGLTVAGLQFTFPRSGYIDVMISQAIPTLFVPVASITVAPSSVSGLAAATFDLVVTARDVDNNVLTGRSAAFTSNNPAIATVDSTGHVVLIAEGTTTIDVNVEGVHATVDVETLPALLSELQYLRTNLAGGDATLSAWYSKDYGLTASGGYASAWADARGAGFGPTLVPTDTAGPAVIGSGSATVLRGSAAHALVSPVSPLLNLSLGKTVVYVGTHPGADGQYVGPFALTPASGFASYLSTEPSLGRQWAAYDGAEHVPFPPGTRPNSARRRMYLAGVTGNLGVVSLWSPPQPIFDDSTAAGAHASADHKLWVLQNAQGGYSTADVSALLVLDKAPGELTAGDIDVLAEWAHTYHGAVTGAEDLIAFEGDSIVAGGGLADTRTAWPKLVIDDAAFATFDDGNFSVGGSVVSVAATPPRSTRIDAAFAGRAGHKVLSLCIGINNLIITGDTAASVEAAIWAYCDARKAATAGLKIAVGVLIPAKWQSAYANQAALDVAINDLNTRIRTNYAAHADAVIDFRTHAAFNADNDWADGTNYQADGVHPTATGFAAMATVALPVLQGLA